MKKYEVGDKFVVEIDKVFHQDGETLYRAKGMKSLVFDEYGLNILKPLKAETMKLLRENAELKERMQKDIDYLCDLCNNQHNLDAARAAGQEEAWELAKKIYCMPEDGGFHPKELIAIFGTVPASSILRSNTYQEAAAKVAGRERKTEEICVGDVVIYNNTPNIHGVVIEIKENCLSVVWQNCSYTYAGKSNFTKTGKHIDMGWLAQIGGDSE